MLNYQKYLCMLLMFLAACDQHKIEHPKAPPNAFAKAYLDSAISIIKANALNRDSVNWPLIKKRAYQLAANAVSYRQTDSAILYVLHSLKDRHSFFKRPETQQKWLGKSKNASRPAVPSGYLDNTGVAYITMPYFASGDTKEMQRYAKETQKLIKIMDLENPCGWVIDLKRNYGGNMWPMIAGLGPLFTTDTLGYVKKGDARTAWSYIKGETRAGKELMFKIDSPYIIKNNKRPIAIVLGKNTASSGEILAISFLGQQNVRTFGKRTAGLATANEDFYLKDSALIVLTTGAITDRRLKVYPSGVVPDVDYTDRWYWLFLKETQINNETVGWVRDHGGKTKWKPRQLKH
jgi:carboxyl-terminal processing protease